MKLLGCVLCGEIKTTPYTVVDADGHHHICESCFHEQFNALEVDTETVEADE